MYVQSRVHTDEIRTMFLLKLPWILLLPIHVASGLNILFPPQEFSETDVLGYNIPFLDNGLNVNRSVGEVLTGDAPSTAGETKLEVDSQPVWEEAFLSEQEVSSIGQEDLLPLEEELRSRKEEYEETMSMESLGVDQGSEEAVPAELEAVKSDVLPQPISQGESYVQAVDPILKLAQESFHEGLLPSRGSGLSDLPSTAKVVPFEPSQYTSLTKDYEDSLEKIHTLQPLAESRNPVLGKSVREGEDSWKLSKLVELPDMEPQLAAYPVEPSDLANLYLLTRHDTPPQGFHQGYDESSQEFHREHDGLSRGFQQEYRTPSEGFRLEHRNMQDPGIIIGKDGATGPLFHMPITQELQQIEIVPDRPMNGGTVDPYAVNAVGPFDKNSDPSIVPHRSTTPVSSVGSSTLYKGNVYQDSSPKRVGQPIKDYSQQVPEVGGPFSHSPLPELFLISNPPHDGNSPPLSLLDHRSGHIGDNLNDFPPNRETFENRIPAYQYDYAMAKDRERALNLQLSQGLYGRPGYDKIPLRLELAGEPQNFEPSRAYDPSLHPSAEESNWEGAVHSSNEYTGNSNPFSIVRGPLIMKPAVEQDASNNDTEPNPPRNHTGKYTRKKRPVRLNAPFSRENYNFDTYYDKGDDLENCAGPNLDARSWSFTGAVVLIAVTTILL
ncbi:hypothetical protein BABINDRAFT_110255 [Babjeviella inositovora NRRL Y-12698]|uniref:Uncharacterized protein n=1 Tax=Babjeviella inositovora NRRL Y-12698 TaxID=984486 RepID=A0A1E3QVL9_9ASCO|nr:uncharacterized protein BABINDRAFT_110255 [Babjeviella inositovora NRRL Y-12698]ODQ81693.1 hypothetical protein BABINDRAFT_110255 [Babjeviella inositovora NRRL Y-12698]